MKNRLTLLVRSESLGLLDSKILSCGYDIIKEES